MSQGLGNVRGLGSFAGVGRAGMLAGAVMLVTLGCIGYWSYPLVVDARAGGAGSGGQDDGQAIVATYRAAVERDSGQIDGRSLFFIPTAPPPPPPPPAPPRAESSEPKTPPPPPPPATYGGPKIIGAVADYVWFDNGKRLKVGGDADGDLRVMTVSEVPWSAKLSWKGIEFDVPFITKDTIVKDGKGMKNMFVGSAPPAPPVEKKEEKKDEKKEATPEAPKPPPG